MNTQKFNAPDMRQALKLVRDALGADAVILSNRKVAGGVEIIAAADYGTFLAEHSAREREANHVPPFMDASAPVVAPAQGDPARLIQQDKRQDPALAEQMKLKADQQRAQSASRQFNELLRRQLQEQRAQADAEPSVEISPQAQARQAQIQAQTQAPAKAPAPAAPRVQPAPAAANGELAAMRSELSQLRNMLNVQLANVSWGDFSYRHPLEANVFKRLTKLGLSPALCRKLTRNLAPEMDNKAAWQHALKELGEDLPLVTEDILAHGGIFAFVGPAGVGKTTTIAKLATRHVLEHGADDIALVTTDSYRIAGHEQLSTLGRILKIPVRVVTEQNSLEHILRGLARKKLVLIDTAGLSHKDQVHREQMKMLEAMGANIQRWLVLSSTCQRRILDKAIDDYKHLNLEGCVFTKLDESASLGEALSVAIEAQLPIAYITDGQNIPDDIACPQPSRLINHAIALAKENKADDSLVADLYSDSLTAQSGLAYA
ncbi:MAG: flagellar biosynthesis protein FlhF [Gammaproteobacteria bacterium]|nr:flagellar biosynthesis protein FlhF [Gammaproteobacteria bacterium]